MEDVFATDLAGVVLTSTTYTTGWVRFVISGFDPPEIPGAIESIAALAPRFGERRHAISMCHPRLEDYSRGWLDRHNFYERSGIPYDNVHYCYTWDGKHPLCEKYKIAYFVDDRVRILNSLITVPHRFLFCPTRRELIRYAHLLPVGVQVHSWAELTPLLLTESATAA